MLAYAYGDIMQLQCCKFAGSSLSVCLYVCVVVCMCMYVYTRMKSIALLCAKMLVCWIVFSL